MNDMKLALFTIALVASSASVCAFAQTSAPAQLDNGTSQAASNGVATSGSQWVAPYGQPTMQKTRAQVYQELVQAEQDGQMAYLNSTVYAHP
jgi:ABC-type phosphate transport system substrate-binding protein